MGVVVVQAKIVAAPRYRVIQSTVLRNMIPNDESDDDILDVQICMFEFRALL